MTTRNEILFEVPGEPVAQGRPRFSSKNKVKRAIDPPASRYYKMLVSHTALQYKPKELIDGSIELYIDVCRSVPKSWSKKKTEAALRKEILPTTRPDVDNYAKGIKDALNGIMYVDDSQITELTVRKYYAEEPKVVVKIIW